MRSLAVGASALVIGSIATSNSSNVQQVLNSISSDGDNSNDGITSLQANSSNSLPASSGDLTSNILGSNLNLLNGSGSSGNANPLSSSNSLLANPLSALTNTPNLLTGTSNNLLGGNLLGGNLLGGDTSSLLSGLTGGANTLLNGANLLNSVQQTSKTIQDDVNALTQNSGLNSMLPSIPNPLNLTAGLPTLSLPTLPTLPGLSGNLMGDASNLLGTSNSLLNPLNLLNPTNLLSGSLLGGANANALSPTNLLGNTLNPLASTSNKLLQGAGGKSDSSSLDGIASAFITNGYLNVAGQNAIKLSGLAADAYSYPDLAAALEGQVPVVNSRGELTQAVQMGLKQMGLTAQTPSALISIALSRGFSARRRMLTEDLKQGENAELVVNHFRRRLSARLERLSVSDNREPTSLRAAKHQQNARRLSSWIDNALGALGNATQKVATKVKTSNMTDDEWKADVQKAADDLADNLEKAAGQLRSGDLSSRLEHWWDQLGTELSKTNSDKKRQLAWMPRYDDREGYNNDAMYQDYDYRRPAMHTPYQSGGESTNRYASNQYRSSDAYDRSPGFNYPSSGLYEGSIRDSFQETPYGSMQDRYNPYRLNAAGSISNRHRMSGGQDDNHYHRANSDTEMSPITRTGRRYDSSYQRQSANGKQMQAVSNPQFNQFGGLAGPLNSIAQPLLGNLNAISSPLANAFALPLNSASGLGNGISDSIYALSAPFTNSLSQLTGGASMLSPEGGSQNYQSPFGLISGLANGFARPPRLLYTANGPMTVPGLLGASAPSAASGQSAINALQIPSLPSINTNLPDTTTLLNNLAKSAQIGSLGLSNDFAKLLNGLNLTMPQIPSSMQSLALPNPAVSDSLKIPTALNFTPPTFNLNSLGNLTGTLNSNLASLPSLPDSLPSLSSANQELFNSSTLKNITDLVQSLPLNLTTLNLSSVINPSTDFSSLINSLGRQSSMGQGLIAPLAGANVTDLNNLVAQSMQALDNVTKSLNISTPTLQALDVNQIQNMLSPDKLAESLRQVSDDLKSGGLDSLLDKLGIAKSTGFQSIGNASELESALRLSGLDPQSLPGYRVATANASPEKKNTELIEVLKNRSGRLLASDSAANLLTNSLKSINDQVVGNADLTKGLGTFDTGLLQTLGNLNLGLANGTSAFGLGLLNTDAGLGSLLSNVNSNLGNTLGNIGGGVGNLGGNLGLLSNNLNDGLSGMNNDVTGALQKLGGWKAPDLTSLGDGLGAIKLPSLPLDSAIPNLTGSKSNQSPTDALKSVSETAEENLKKLMSSLGIQTPTLPPLSLPDPLSKSNALSLPSLTLPKLPSNPLTTTSSNPLGSLGIASPTDSLSSLLGKSTPSALQLPTLPGIPSTSSLIPSNTDPLADANKLLNNLLQQGRQLQSATPPGGLWGTAAGILNNPFNMGNGLGLGLGQGGVFSQAADTVNNAALQLSQMGLGNNLGFGLGGNPLQQALNNAQTFAAGLPLISGLPFGGGLNDFGMNAINQLTGRSATPYAPPVVASPVVAPAPLPASPIVPQMGGLPSLDEWNDRIQNSVAQARQQLWNSLDSLGGVGVNPGVLGVGPRARLLKSNFNEESVDGIKGHILHALDNLEKHEKSGLQDGSTAEIKLELEQARDMIEQLKVNDTRRLEALNATQGQITQRMNSGMALTMGGISLNLVQKGQRSLTNAMQELTQLSGTVNETLGDGVDKIIADLNQTSGILNTLSDLQDVARRVQEVLQRILTMPLIPNATATKRVLAYLDANGQLSLPTNGLLGAVKSPDAAIAGSSINDSSIDDSLAAMARSIDLGSSTGIVGLSQAFNLSIGAALTNVTGALQHLQQLKSLQGGLSNSTAIVQLIAPYLNNANQNIGVLMNLQNLENQVNGIIRGIPATRTLSARRLVEEPSDESAKDEESLQQLKEMMRMDAQDEIQKSLQILQQANDTGAVIPEVSSNLDDAIKSIGAYADLQDLLDHIKDSSDIVVPRRLQQNTALSNDLIKKILMLSVPSDTSKILQAVAANSSNLIPMTATTPSNPVTSYGQQVISAQQQQASNQTTPLDLDQLVEKVSASHLNLTELIVDLANSNLDLNTLISRGVAGQLKFDDVVKIIAASNLNLDHMAQELNSSGLALNDVVHDLARSTFSIDQFVQKLAVGGVDFNKTIKDLANAGVDYDSLLKYLTASGIDLDAVADSAMVVPVIKSGVLANPNLAALLGANAPFPASSASLIPQQSKSTVAPKRLLYGIPTTSSSPSTASTESQSTTTSTPAADRVSNISVVETLDFKQIGNTSSSSYEARVSLSGFEWDPKVSAAVPPLLVCWSVPTLAEGSGFPKLVVDAVHLSFGIDGANGTASIDLLHPDIENVLQYYAPDWNNSRILQRRQNELCTHVPVCSSLEALNKIHGDYRIAGLPSSVKAAIVIEATAIDGEVVMPTGKIIVRGFYEGPSWDYTDANDGSVAKILARISGSPAFALELPKPNLLHLGGNQGYAVIAAANAEGLKYNFTQEDWSWIPMKARPAFSRIIEQLKDLGEEELNDATNKSLVDKEDEYSALVFNPKRDLPLSIPAFSFVPRVILEISNVYLSNNAPYAVQRCLPVAQSLSSGALTSAMKPSGPTNMLVSNIIEMLREAASAEETSVRVKSVIESIPVEGLVSGQDAIDTINLDGRMIEEYSKIVWNIDVSLTALTLSDYEGISGSDRRGGNNQIVAI